jgi:hypothetical protein
MSETALDIAPATHGKVLMERQTHYGRVCLIYWGKDESPKLTVVVEDDFPYIMLGENDERTTELYYHPFSSTALRLPITDIKGTYE